MATRMKLKLKTVFVLYFMVSLMGLIYALMQLGKTVYLSFPCLLFSRHLYLYPVRISLGSFPLSPLCLFSFVITDSPMKSS